MLQSATPCSRAKAARVIAIRAREAELQAKEMYRQGTNLLFMESEC
jgi:hypothetical protein